MTTRPHNTRISGPVRGFTLIELMATMIIISTVAAVTSGILMSASQVYAKSATQRRSAENVASALDRVVRLFREAPSKTSPAGAADMTSAGPTAVSFSDGSGVSLSGSVLRLSGGGITNSPLCNGVTAFTLTYLDSAGATVNVAGGTDTVRRVTIRLAAGGTELQSTAWLRASLNE